jgi:hypothetical protein
MRILRALCVLCAFAVEVGLAAEVAGVKLDDKVRIAPDAPELVLNGAGVRTRVIVKVYVAGLYLPEKKGTAADVLALSGPKRVWLSMLREVTGSQMSEALTDGFRANNPPADQERFKAQLAELATALGSVGSTKAGDTLAFDFLPGSGMVVLLNGQPRGKPIADEGFYRALLRAWLGDRPVDSDLKKGLLGQG